MRWNNSLFRGKASISIYEMKRLEVTISNLPLYLAKCVKPNISLRPGILLVEGVRGRKLRERLAAQNVRVCFQFPLAFVDCEAASHSVTSFDSTGAGVPKAVRLYEVCHVTGYFLNRNGSLLATGAGHQFRVRRDGES